MIARVLFGGILAVCFLAGTAAAFECDPITDRPIESYDDQEVVFVGVFLGYTDLEGRPLTEEEIRYSHSREWLAKFQVVEAWRGVEKRTTLVAWTAEWLPTYVKGQRVLVVVPEAADPGYLPWAEPCSGSFVLGTRHLESWEKKVFAHLGPPSVVWPEE